MFQETGCDVNFHVVRIPYLSEKEYAGFSLVYCYACKPSNST